MELKYNEKELLYKMYLLECLNQDIEQKIDNPPLNYELFLEKLEKNKKI